MNTLNIQPKKLLDQLVKLPDLAKKNNWRISYDEDTDELYYAPKIIPDNTTIFSFADEFALYIDQASNIKGIFIEYFSTNFTEHEKEFKKIVEMLDKDEDGYKTSDNHTDDMELATGALTGEVLRSYYTFFEKIEKSKLDEEIEVKDQT